MTLTCFVFTELANTMKYGGGVLYNLIFHRVTSLRFTEWSMMEGVLYNLNFTEWRHCVSQNSIWAFLNKHCMSTVHCNGKTICPYPYLDGFVDTLWKNLNKKICLSHNSIVQKLDQHFLFSMSDESGEVAQVYATHNRVSDGRRRLLSWTLKDFLYWSVLIRSAHTTTISNCKTKGTTYLKSKQLLLFGLHGGKQRPPVSPVMKDVLWDAITAEWWAFPPDTRRCCDVESTSMIQRRSNVVCPVGVAVWSYHRHTMRNNAASDLDGAPVWHFVSRRGAGCCL